MSSHQEIITALAEAARVPETIAAAGLAIEDTPEFRRAYRPCLNGELHPAAVAMAQEAMTGDFDMNAWLTANAAPVQVLNMPPPPWIDLPDGQQYAWGAALGGAIAAAASRGQVTVLADAQGHAVAQIGPPGSPS
jgi:hypothetical protein